MRREKTRKLLAKEKPIDYDYQEEKMNLIGGQAK